MELLILGSFFAVVTGLFIFVLWTPGKLKKRYAASSGWFESQATVVSAQVLKHYSSDGDYYYRPQINYKYHAGGAERQSDKIGLITIRDFVTRAECESWLEDYMAGSVVTAWYDPANPTDSALEIDKPPNTIIFLIMALFCLLFLVFLGRQIVFELMK
jgi:hypothetical protein